MLKLSTAIFVSLFLSGASEVLKIHVVDHNDLALYTQEYKIDSFNKYEISSELAFGDNITLEEAFGLPNLDIDVTKFEENKPSRRRRGARSKAADIDIDLTQVEQGSQSSESALPNIDVDVTKASEADKTIPSIDIDVTKEEEIKPMRRRRERKSKETNVDIDLTKVEQGSEGSENTLPDIDIDVTQASEDDKTIPSIDIDMTKEEEIKPMRRRRERKSKETNVDIDLTKPEDHKDNVKVDIDESLMKTDEKVEGDEIVVAADEANAAEDDYNYLEDHDGDVDE